MQKQWLLCSASCYGRSTQPGIRSSTASDKFLYKKWYQLRPCVQGPMGPSVHGSTRPRAHGLMGRLAGICVCRHACIMDTYYWKLQSSDSSEAVSCRPAEMSRAALRIASAEIPVRIANSLANALASESAKCEICGETPEPWPVRIAKSCENRLVGPPCEKAKCELFISHGEYSYIWPYNKLCYIYIYIA